MGDKPEFKSYGTGYTTPREDVNWCRYAKVVVPEHEEVADVLCQRLLTGECVLAELAVKGHFQVALQESHPAVLELQQKQDKLRSSLGLDNA